MTSLDDAGAYVPWRVRRDTDWKKQFLIKRNGVPVDISDDAVDIKVVKAENDKATVIKDLAPTIAASGDNWVVRVDLDAVDTDVDVGIYWWYFVWTDNTNTDVIPLMSGPFTVEP
jgi:hypothetical protein